MEVVRVVNRVEVEGMVDGDSSGVSVGRGRDWKNGREMDVMVIYSWRRN